MPSMLATFFCFVTCALSLYHLDITETLLVINDLHPSSVGLPSSQAGRASSVTYWDGVSNASLVAQ